MIDKRDYTKSIILQELEDDTCHYWFDFKQRKFLHQIDTFYYSIKLQNDMTTNTNDPNVIKFRRDMDKLQSQMIEKGYSNDYLQFYLPNCQEYLNVLPLSFANRYTLCFSMPEYYHIFIAPVVPGNENSGTSVTCEIIVQIRSYMLWLMGVTKAFEQSYEVAKAFCEFFNLQIDFVQENRVDFCWHTNYLSNPEKFFTIENFYKMRVDQYDDAYFHTAKVGSEDYEVDYVNLGRKGGKCFIRIYLKSKEVIEQGYKAFFFKTWLLHGLINRYDFNCYEQAYLKGSWKYLTIARLNFYFEHGKNEKERMECKKQINDYEKNGKIKDIMIELANKLTPKVNLIMNIEYQTMRKSSKTYTLIPISDNSKKKEAKRIYDYLDNRKIINDYLTHEIFRLVERNGDSNKSRRPDCAFWSALRSTKLVDVKPMPKQLKLVRTYNRKLNSQKMKESVINKAVTYGVYLKGKNDDNPMEDVMMALMQINDNDIHRAVTYKCKKSKQLNDKELAQTILQKPFTYDFALINQVDGEIYDKHNIGKLISQENSDKELEVNDRK